MSIINEINSKSDEGQDYIDNVLIKLKPGDEEYMTEKERLEHYGHCPECDEVRTGENWCQPCNATHFQQTFSTWTSGNVEIDYFIQNTQIYANEWRQALEWYPWEMLQDIEKIIKGFYSTVFRAKRRIRRIESFDKQSKSWCRFTVEDNQVIALKTIGRSKDFLIEVKNSSFYIFSFIKKILFNL